MNESDATAPTTAPAAESTAPAVEAAQAHTVSAEAAPASGDGAAAPAAAATAQAEQAPEVAAAVAEAQAEPPAEQPAREPESASAGAVQTEHAPEVSQADEAQAENPVAEPGPGLQGEAPRADPAYAAIDEAQAESPESTAVAEAPATAEAPVAAETTAVAETAAAGETAPRAPAPSQPVQRPPDPRAEERRQRAQQAWERVVSARESGEVLNGTVTAAVKGGLLVDVGGIRGFLPASQVRVPIGTAIDTLVRTKVPLKVIDVDQTRRRIVVSHRRAAEEERRNKRSELLHSLAVGQVREGVVVRLADFGAFVDLGGVDGLIPMRELAFERIDKAGDVVTIGEKLQVEVLRIDENGKKISLSRRNALPDPWRDHANVLRQGSTVEGKVVGKEPRLQVEIAPGVVGSVRESDADPADYEIGEAIEVLIRRVDRATRRITLTTMHGAAAVPPPQTSSTSSGFAPLGIELGRRQ